MNKRTREELCVNCEDLRKQLSLAHRYIALLEKEETPENMQVTEDEESIKERFTTLKTNHRKLNEVMLDNFMALDQRVTNIELDTSNLRLQMKNNEYGPNLEERISALEKTNEKQTSELLFGRMAVVESQGASLKRDVTQLCDTYRERSDAQRERMAVIENRHQYFESFTFSVEDILVRIEALEQGIHNRWTDKPYKCLDASPWQRIEKLERDGKYLANELRRIEQEAQFRVKALAIEPKKRHYT